MFLFHDLLSHAELLKRKFSPAATPTADHGAEARQAPRRQRCGPVTLYPVARHQPIDPLEEETRVAAAISNVSSTGMGLVHSEQLPEGLEFDIRWEIEGRPSQVRLQVVHCRPTTAGVYRTGARLVSGVLPEEPELRIIPSPVEEVIDVEPSTPTSPTSPEEYSMCIDPSMSMDLSMVQIDAQPNDSARHESDHLMPGVLRFEPVPAQPPLPESAELPGTFKVSRAFGFDKTERLEGVTTCGFERSIEMRRDGNRLYLYIHSPGKKNGWGIYVDPAEFEAAFNRVQDAAKSPFLTTLAA